MSHYLKNELYELIKKDERIFEFIQDGSLDGIWYWDLKNPENEWMNPRFWEVLGYDPREMPHLASAWQDIINKDDLALALDNFNKHAADPNHPYDQNVRYTHKDGSTVWIRCRGLIIRDDDGTPLRMLGAHQNITELKETERQLKEEKDAVYQSEIKYRTLYEQAPFACQSLDADCTIIEVNSKWLEILDYDKNDVIGKPFDAFIHSEDKEQFHKNFEKLLHNATSPESEYRLLKPNGETINALIEGCIYTNPQGEFLQTYCTFKDITKEKRNAQKIRMLNNAVEHSLNAFDIVDENGEFIYVNQAYADMWGYQSPSEIIGNSPKDHCEDPLIVETIVDELRKHGKCTIEFKAKKKDGSLFDVLMYARLDFDEQGNEIYPSTSLDISATKIHQNNLRKSEEKFRALFEQTGGYCMILDPNTDDGIPVIVDANLAAIESHGYTRDEFIGRPVAIVDDEEGRKEVLKHTKQIMSGEPFRIENTHIRKDGTTFDVSVNAIRIDIEGEPPLIFTTEYDITQQKLDQQKLKESEEKLRLAIDHSPLGITINDKEGNFVSTNSAYEKMLGYTKEELSKITFFEITHPDYLNKNQKLFDKLNSPQREGFHFEKKYIKKDGSFIDVRVHTGAIVGSNGDEMFGMALVEDITQQKIEEQKLEILYQDLKESEERLALTAEGANLAMWDWTLESGELFLNDKWFELKGYTHEELSPTIEWWKEQIHPDDLAKTEAAIDDHIKGRTDFYKAEFRVKTKSGDWIWLVDRGKVTKRDENGQVLRLSGTHVDITERKLAEQELIRQRDMFETVINSVPDRIFWKDLNSIYLGCNEQFAKEAGAGSVDSIVGKSDYELVWRDEAEKFISDDRSVMGSGKANINFEEEYIDDDGNTVYWKTSKIPMFNSEGKCFGILATSENITEQKRSSEIVDTFFDMPLNIHLIATLEGEIKRVNKGWEKILGYNDQELVGKNYIDLIHSDDIEKTTNEMMSLERGKTTFYFENRYRHKNGHYITLVWSAKATMTNRLIHAVAHDISERKRAQQRLEEQNEELSRAKTHAEESNKLKTEFLHNMSHEIRTPMNGIMGFSEFLCDPDSSRDERIHYSSIVQNCSTQLLRIIDDILEISTLETKQISAVEETVCINDLLLELFSIYDLKSKERKLPLHVNRPHDNERSTILTDRSKLNKILSNLLDNAFKFTNSGSIEFGYKLKEGSMILYVEDTGIGISEENMERIFRRFSQESKDISHTFGGLGLGLSISKENAKLLGGDISVISRKGEGSKFTVTIPYKTKAASITGEITSISNLTGSSRQAPPRCRSIMVAEDEEVNYLYIEMILKKIFPDGLDIVHAKNGQEAVDIHDTHDGIILILMDIKMPLLNGYEATEIIKKKNPKLPIIAQTAFSTEADRDLALSRGCDDFISKPIKKPDLEVLLKKHLPNTKTVN